MARHKDANWSLPDQPSTEGAILTVLMDIRDELKLANATLRSYSFVHMPHDIASIRRALTVTPRITKRQAARVLARAAQRKRRAAR